ncbi:hydratase [Aliiruegeria lutimaris]|uniref:2-keto-4-pentenoate hydratase n=1 Tax=Aliiruegeria lutimaris TaxID=571298 RepID=A0A1G8S320_9RHOB|nr:hydratase [Aliiruegeria lutimaris]SDJ23561.1 2-keto-4-pentenoate hydratase [Aliiruegeria lutimaris]
MTTVEAISRALLEARRTERRLDASTLPVPDYDEALEIQRRVQATIGPVGGFKVARRGEASPVIAPIPASLILPSGATVPVRDQMGIELEIGFELVAEPTTEILADPKAFFRPRIVLELVDTRLAGGADDPMMKLADMQINAGLILGAGPEDWDGTDFGAVSASLRCGDRQVVDGEATVPGGSALANLALFCAHVGDHCGGFRKGQTIITGSLSGLEYFPGGTHVAGLIEGFGEISSLLE